MKYHLQRKKFTNERDYKSTLYTLNTQNLEFTVSVERLEKYL